MLVAITHIPELCLKLRSLLIYNSAILLKILVFLMVK
jgi:hypothetical protein